MRLAIGLCLLMAVPCAASVPTAPAVSVAIPDTIPLFSESVTGDTAAVYRQLGELGARGLARNPELQAAARRIDALQQRPAQAAARPAPVLGGEADRVPFADPSEYMAVNLFAQQTFPATAKLESRARVASYPALLAAAAQEREVNDLRRDIALAWFDYGYAHEALRLNGEQSQLVDWLRQVAEARYTVGRAPQQDVWLAQVEISALEAARLALEGKRALARAQLVYLLGGDTQLLLPAPAGVPVRTYLPDLPAAERLALAQRPELRAARLAVDAEAARALLARAELLPDVTTRVTSTARTDADDAVTGMVMLDFPLAPWSRGGAEAQEREAQLTQAEQAVRVTALENRIRGELQGTLAELQAAAAQVRLYRGTIMPQAEQAFRAALAGYTYGQVEFATTLVAARAAVQQRDGELRARVAYEQAFSRLLWATGTDQQQMRMVLQ